MPDIDPRHIDAVAATFSSDGDVCGSPGWTNAFTGQQIARALLTSTDPAMLDAMQDALVRAGRLTKERAIDKPGRRGINPQCRYVTEWEPDHA